MDPYKKKKKEVTIKLGFLYFGKSSLKELIFYSLKNKENGDITSLTDFFFKNKTKPKFVLKEETKQPQKESLRCKEEWK